MAKATIIDAASAVDKYTLIEYDSLVPAEDNVRGVIDDTDDLAESIFQNNLQQPLRVVSLGDGTFKIIAGHRRHHALGMLILAKQWTGPIPCMVTAEISDSDRVAAMIVENLQRSDLNPIEEGNAFQRLVKDFGYTQAELALKVGRSPSYVSDRISLLKLPDTLIDAVRVGYFPLTVGLELTKVGDDDAVLAITKDGRIIPSFTQIAEAALKVKHAKLLAEWEKAIEKSGVDVFTPEDRFDMLRRTELIEFQPDTPKALAKLPLLPPRTKLLLKSEPWRGTVTVEMRQFLTDAQLKARAKKLEQEQAERASAYEAEQLARWEKEKAAMSAARQQWVDECEAIKAHNDAERKRYMRDIDAAEGAWAQQVDAKTVARWAMLDVLNSTFDELTACRMLGLDTSTVTSQATLAEYAQRGAKELVAATAAVLLASQQDNDEDDPVYADLLKFVNRQNIPAADLRELPPEPEEDTVDDDADDQAVA